MGIWDYSNSLTTRHILVELNYLERYPSSQKPGKNFVVTWRRLTKSEIGYFHFVVVQWRQRNLQKCVMRDWQLLLVFWPYRCHHRPVISSPCNEFFLFRTSSLLFQLVQFVKCWLIFLIRAVYIKFRKRTRKSFSCVDILCTKRLSQDLPNVVIFPFR